MRNTPHVRQRRASSEFLEELTRRPALAGTVLFRSFADDRPHFRILELEVILEFVNVHEGGERDPVFLEDHVLLVEVDALHDGAEGIPEADR